MMQNGRVCIQMWSQNFSKTNPRGDVSGQSKKETCLFCDILKKEVRKMARALIT